MSEEQAQLWDEQDWVTATFTDPRTQAQHLVTVTGYHPVRGGRSLILFPSGHKRWVAQADVKR